jgi:hypothetical protein
MSEKFYLQVYNAIKDVESQPTCSSKTLVAFNGLHCVISQKIELFITIAVRTSNPVLHLSTVVFVYSNI